MKIPSRLTRNLWIIVLATASILGCETEQNIPVDELYRFNNLNQLQLANPAKLNYFLGIDKNPVPLSVTLFDARGSEIAAPQEVVSFYSNNVKLPAASFTPKTVGTFNLVGKLAGKVSNTVQIKVWNPASLTIRISVVNKSTDQFFANGADSVKLQVELLNGTEVIDEDFPLVIYANGKAIGNGFATTTQGEYKFTATALGLTSNQIVLKAVASPTLSIVRLPVIFHEVNKSQLTAASIKALTDGMTKAYRNNLNRANRAKDVNATDLYVEFYPAPTGLDGKALSSPGLDRVTSQKTSFTQEDTYSDSFNYFWDPVHFINVWVYPNITGDYANSSWAYNPFVTQPLAGMTVINKSTKPFLPFGVFLNATHLVGQNTDEILAHEAGHLLGLEHVFAGNGSTFNGCPASDPDYCSDTRYYNRDDYAKSITTNFSDRYKRNSCTNEIYEATNFMDYYYCYNNSFTLEQSKRVRHAVNYGLWLPTPSNGFQNARLSGILTMVERPTNLVYYKPVICE